MLKPQIDQQRREIWKKGLPDRESAKEAGISSPAWTLWRKSRKLPSNRVRSMVKDKNYKRSWNKR